MVTVIRQYAVSSAIFDYRASEFFFLQRLQEQMTKHSATLGRDAVYMKKMRVSRLPAYMTIQMVRFQFKQRDAVNAKILKDIK